MYASEKTYHYLSQFLTSQRDAKIKSFAQTSSDFILPVLEDVYQYRNAAAIVRSVEGCGFHKVIALEEENTFDPNLTVTKGAETWVEVEKLPSTKESLQQIKNRGYEIVAVSLENNATKLPDFKIKGPLALAFGTEWKGVSNGLLDIADRTLEIPMYGLTQSFNVSVAAGIAMYSLKQQLLTENIDHFLSEEKKWDLMVRWAVNSIPSGKAILDQYLTREN